MNPRRLTLGLGSLLVCAAGLSPTPAESAPTSGAASVGGSALAWRLPDDFNPVGVSALSPADAWVVGNPQYGSNNQQATFEHWDGEHWSKASLPDTPRSFVDAVLAFSPSDAWATGDFPDSHHAFLHWDGASWRQVRSPGVNGYLVDLSAVSPTNIWAVGQTGHHALVERWDGGSWSVFPSADRPRHVRSSYRAVSALSADDVWAVGFAYNLRTQRGASILDHWDGSTWSRIDLSLGSEDGLSDVEAISSSDVWVVGHTVDAPLTEHWDGTSWTAFATPAPGLSSSLSRLSAVSSSDIWAIGGIYQGDHPTTVDVMTMHWDGSTWTQVPIKGGRAPRDALTSLSPVDPDDVWAVGYSAGKPIVRHWDGSTWS